MNRPSTIASLRGRPILRRFAAPAALLLIAVTAAADGARLIVHATSARPSAPAGWYLCAVASVLAGTAVLAASRERAAVDDERAPTDDSGPGGLTQAWRAIALMVLYAYALPWVGFAVTTAVFAIGYLLWVAKYPIVRAVAYGLAMDVVTVVLFDQASVVLPAGAYGF